ncbi:MAG: 2-C-methyl-D-erythritol 4-phosphate cytidylyltransferase [Acidobacteriota bacterium]
MNTAIIAAAGSGSRLNSDTPKQFIEILGKPLIQYTIEKFASCSVIDAIIVVTSSIYVSFLDLMIARDEFRKPIRTVMGGETRAESVYRGFQEISDNTKIVVIHDGARPMVSEGEIAKTVQAAIEAGASCLVAPVTDTVKRVNGGMITETIDRSTLRRALTPQAFRVELLKEAYLSAELTDAVTDECMLVERLGRPVAVVEGSPINIKITHPEDIAAFENYLRADH